MPSSESPSADSLLSHGIAASQANDSADAIAWFAKACAAAPSSGLPQFLLGSEYASLGDMHQAEAALANAVLLSPDLSIARYQLGLLQFSSGRASVALLTWTPLLDLPATDPLPHYVRGYAALAQDRFDEALQCYRQGLACPTTNFALSRDIDMVVARIHALPGVAATAGAPALHDEPLSEAQAHVLLANYQQPGRAH